MTPDERIRHTVELLVSNGWEADEAREAATEAVEEDAPVLETLCFHTLAEHLLASIHDASWIANRADKPDSDGHDIIKRLLDSGASPDDLAVFARLMQREYLSNLGCLLDGAGIYGTPQVPFQEFRVFAVDDEDKPLGMIDELHESLGFEDWETEMKLSRKAAAEQARLNQNDD